VRLRAVQPRGLLIDLDDTILDDSGSVDACWMHACRTYEARVPGVTAERLYEAVRQAGEWFWSDAERHRLGRLHLEAARAEVVALALDKLGQPDRQLAAAIADVYSRLREDGMQPLPDAIETVRWLRACGVRLALLTNGGADPQRRKLERFGLTDAFDVVLVEGEVGFGKPDERIYRLALDRLGLDADAVWMVGDNLDWDVVAPKKLGIFSIWIDIKGKGLPSGLLTPPDVVLRTLSELRRLAGSNN
jgi:putative hydrolase of the HAD superfamily